MESTPDCAVLGTGPDDIADSMGGITSLAS